MAKIDPAWNFGKIQLSAGVDTTDTTFNIVAGEVATMLDPTASGLGPYNIVIYDATTYAGPEDDPSREIVRVTDLDTTNNTLTVTRAQESTTASAHDTTGKVYKLIRAMTAVDWDKLREFVFYDTGTGTTKTTPGAVNKWFKIDVGAASYWVPGYTSQTS